MKRLLKTSILLFISTFICLTFPSCSVGGHANYKYSRYKTHHKSSSRNHKRYYKNRTSHHSRPVSKDYIIKNKRRDRGW